MFGSEDEFDEEALEEINNRIIASYAAVLVAQGETRQAAVEKAREIVEEQAIAENDITGVHGTLEEAQAPDASGLSRKKLRAIENELFEELMSGSL